MGFFKLGTMTIGSMFKKPETLRYPFEKKEPYEGQKGTVKHIDAEACNLCGVCEKRCPCHAIKVDREKKTWSVEHFQCIQCGYCVMGCPKKCLAMDKAKPDVVAEKVAEVVNIPLPDKKPAEKPAPKPAESPENKDVTTA